MESNGVLLVSLEKQRPDSNFSRSQKKIEEVFSTGDTCSCYCSNIKHIKSF